MLTVIDPDGRPSGVQYDRDLPIYHRHHEQYGQRCVWWPYPLPEPDESGVYPLIGAEVLLQAWRESVVVTPLQLRRALRALGWRTALLNYLKATDEETREEWELVTEIGRLDTIILKAKATMHWTDTNIDRLFEKAETFPRRS